MGPGLTLDFEQTQVRNPARGRHLLEVYSKDEADARFSPSGHDHEVFFEDVLSGSATLDFPEISASGVSDLTISVEGAEVGDVVALGIPSDAAGTTMIFFAWVSSKDIVTVRAANIDSAVAENPVSGIFNVLIFRV